ncbi:MAG: DUF2341 domain-containing protein [Candidatus Shapirobacteria bacterium]|jgi:hypothetical protein
MPKSALIYRLITRKITIAKWQLNLFGVICLTIGLVVGSYFTLKGISHTFAANSWTQTDWNGESGTNIDTTTAGQLSLTLTSGWSSDYVNWRDRKKIIFNNTNSNIGTTSEELTDFPVLIKLNKDSDIDYAKTKTAGADIRFTDADGMVLNYEIEKWDETGSSYIWVKVPQIEANSSTDYIYMYYGNSEAIDSQNKTGVWDSNFLGVWHADDSSLTSLEDSTSNNKDGTKQSSNQPSYTSNGIIAGAQTYNQSLSRTATSIGNTLTDFTVEVWYKDDRVITGYERLADKNYSDGFWFGRNSSSANSWGGGVRENGGSYGVFVTLSDGDWHQISSIRSGTTHFIYGDGVSVGASNPVSALPLDATNFAIGGYGNNGNPSQGFGGTIDEVRFSSSARSKAWIAASYKSGTDAFNTFELEERKYPSSGTITSNILDTLVSSDWGKLTFGTSIPDTSSVSVKVRTSNSNLMVGASGFDICTPINSDTDISSNNCVKDTDRYVQYQVTLNSTSNVSTPTFYDISIEYSASDQIKPTVNATSIVMVGLGNTAWTGSLPTIGWTGGTDNEGGSGIFGYCIALDGEDIGASSTLLEPSSASGVLAGLDDQVTQAYCPYIVVGNSLNLASIGLTLPSNQQYYFSIKAVDRAGNIYTGSADGYQDLISFKYDSSIPTNVTYISTPGGNFSNVDDMSFTWPTSGNGMATDVGAGVLGWQYQVNTTDGEWLGTIHSDLLGINYIPSGTASYTLTNEKVGGTIVSGSNTIYFRTVDKVGNFSLDATVRTGALSFGGAAPAFGGSDKVLVDPIVSDTNYFSLSWPEAKASEENEVSNYYYMVNTPPPSSLDTLRSNGSTYIDVNGNLAVATKTLAGVNKGTNTVYVVAIDDATTPNYSPSNYISGTFTLNSTDPDNVANLIASDSSIKSQLQWNVTLTWTVPLYQGAGNLTYDIYRSTNGTTFTKVGSSSGLSYVDNTPISAKYYYKIYTRDGASASSSGSNAVSITPTGKWTVAPTLQSGPTTSSITTKKATISWSTDRAADSKVQYGTGSGDYYTEEPSNSTQGTAHTINLTNLSPGTNYYYRVKWTDEDGNTGMSDEENFETDPAPIVTDPKVKNVSISSVILEYTTKGASKVKIYFGTTTAFGGIKEINTSSSEDTYITELTGLEDGTKYYYKINTFDNEDSEYEGNVLAFETLPRPKISNVRIQEVKGAAQPTVLVSWTTNTETSSIVTYYPEGQVGQARDEINIALIKGEHKLLLKGLLANTPYVLVTKGRDKVGNEALSDSQRFTTATDTRPPQIMNLKIEGSVESSVNNGSNSQATAQLIVSWDTDEAGSSQVEFGEGTSNDYSQKTQEDTNLTYNHLVIISNLTPSKVYHLRAHSKDKIGNDGTSIDTVTITPKSVSSAFELVVGNLTDVFGFLKGIQQ